MPEYLAQHIDSSLPPELVEFLHRAGESAAGEGKGLYLVGGMVRDVLLGTATLDLDLVVEGDAVELAQELAQIYRAKITSHWHFGTATLHWNGWSADLATARAETYARPGALPTVKPDTIEKDLFRRDFTVNAMATYLTPERYGELIDLYHGQKDLRAGLIRVLHPKSFIDDATRIWRAIRYEQRLGFQIEESTLRWLKRDIPLLETISADRIRYEIECILQEKRTEKVFRRADELGVLAQLHPALSGNGWLATRFEEARRISPLEGVPQELYLALLTYRLSERDAAALIGRLNLPRSPARALRDTTSLKKDLAALTAPGTPPSRIYKMLSGCSEHALKAVIIADEPPKAARKVRLYLEELRRVKPVLTGEDVQQLGVPAGPDIGKVLELLHTARLDGEVSTKEQEVALVRSWLEKRSGSRPF